MEVFSKALTVRKGGDTYFMKENELANQKKFRKLEKVTCRQYWGFCLLRAMAFWRLLTFRLNLN